jgi:hypothetical protein
METLQQAVQITKEQIQDCLFPTQDLHQNNEELNLLKIKLDHAAKLGNNFKSKCKLYFMDNDGLKVVETTIWASCEKNIIIKYGIMIPIRRILDVKF